MAKAIKLKDICKGKSYQVSGFVDASSDYADKLIKMGFVIGTPVRLAPVKLFDPIVIQIRGSRIALRRTEAQDIFVEEL